MAHRSKLSQIAIDCTDLHRGLAFWGGALGLPAAAATIEGPYGTLGDIGGLHIVVQRVPEPKVAKSRVHLDIETDDIEAKGRMLRGDGWYDRIMPRKIRQLKADLRRGLPRGKEARQGQSHAMGAPAHP